MDRLQSFLFSIVASIFVWTAVVAAKLVGANDGMISFAIFAAFGGNLAIWLVWAFTVYGDKPAEPAPNEKAKRDAGIADRPQDARLALLLELLDEDDRRELKRRLMDDLGADGEMVSLADLLGAPDRHTGQGHR